EIKDELRQVQHATLNDNLRWMDVELALATEDEQVDNTIIDGFQTVEKKVGEFAEGNEGSELIQLSSEDHEFKHITGESKSEEEIRQFSKDLFKIKDDVEINITKSGDGADVPLYSVSYQDGKDVYMDITEKGAHPIQILVERSIGEKEISLNDGLIKAEKYLEQFNYDDMTAFQSQQFDNTGVFSFIYTQEDVRMYPDSKMLKVDFDNVNTVEFML